MQLTLREANDRSLRAGYSCPCGCTPSVEYARGAELVEEGCCCGNRFAVGPQAAASLTSRPGFRRELQTFDAPWGQRLEAAWLVGPSVHGPAASHDHEQVDGYDHGTVEAMQAIDPVCGMTVDSESTRATGRHGVYKGSDYFFCGKGCKLDFDEDPDRYLDPGYVPSM
jgi:YHS domain-containing protein